MSTAENMNPHDEPENLENESNQPIAAAEQDCAQTGVVTNTTDPLETLKTERDEMRDKMLRAMAEIENTRKRAERMQSDVSRYAIAGFARDMLDIADNLRRAIDAVPESECQIDTIKNLIEGVSATERMLLAVFEKQGIKKIAPTEGRFDPNLHEVMFEVDSTDKEGGEIVQLLEAGYVIHDRLLRPARVSVAKASNPTQKDHQINQEV